MLISTKGRYALRVLIDMAEHGSEKYIKLKDIAERQEISEKYLENIVKDLVKHDIITGLRGKGGGYKLSADADQIIIGDVLKIMEGTLSPVSCLSDETVICSRASQCRTLEFWKGLDDVINRYVNSFSIADLVLDYDAGNDYII